MTEDELAVIIEVNERVKELVSKVASSPSDGWGYCEGHTGTLTLVITRDHKCHDVEFPTENDAELAWYLYHAKQWDTIDSLLALVADLQSALLDQWQPITSDLPATDNAVLLTNGITVHEGIRAWQYAQDDPARFETNDGRRLDRMTHWQPKPAPPSSEK